MFSVCYVSFIIFTMFFVLMIHNIIMKLQTLVFLIFKLPAIFLNLLKFLLNQNLDFFRFDRTARSLNVKNFYNKFSTFNIVFSFQIGKYRKT